MFGRNPKPANVPPAIPPSSSASVPPVIPAPPIIGAPPPIIQQPRAWHHGFTHEFLVDAYTAENRGRFIAMFGSKDFEVTMKAGWQALARLHGAGVVPVDELHASAFRHESYLCGFFVFPKAIVPGEAVAGLVMAGPAEKWPPMDLSKLPVNYFVLERTNAPVTVIKKHTANGFAEVGKGPAAGQDVRLFVQIVFGMVFGTKRPDAQEAARRLLILRHLVVYSQASQYGKALHGLPDLSAEAKGDLHSIMGGLFSQQLQKENLWDHVSAWEQAFFGTPVQNLTQRDVLNAFWRKEAAHTLMWALNLCPLNAYDVEAAEKTALDVGTAGLEQFIARSELRTPEEIDKARQVAELWHWRSRTRELQEANRPFETNEALKKAGIHTYEDVVRMSAEAAEKEGDIPPRIGDDFPAYGKPYRDLDPNEWSRVRSISIERHFTLNWLCGRAFGNDWDKTPTDT
jgi:hypothetical protein